MIKLKEADLLQVCGSAQWAREMAAHTFPNPKEVSATGDSIWQSLKPEDWLEAFRAHPKIGEHSNSAWSREEQAGSRHASEHTRAELLEWNRKYEEKFGYIFIVCATGKSTATILEQLKTRHSNEPDIELRNAAEEQRQILHLRLKRILAPYTYK